MHVIQDLESFLKKIEETIAHYFGKDEAGVVGFAAIKAEIQGNITTEASAEAAPPVDNESSVEVVAEILPPIDNEHVEEGATQFTEEEIAANAPEETETKENEDAA